jgi:hypothetical protein
MKHKDWKRPIIVEWTARDTPQQNSPVEVGFRTLSGRARAMLQEANMPEDMRKLLMPEAVKTATHLDGLIPVEINGVLKTKYNASTETRTNHIDTRIHYLRDLTQGDDKFWEIEYVRSEDNQSDTFTKNTPHEIFCKHTSKYMTEID